MTRDEAVENANRILRLEVERATVKIYQVGQEYVASDHETWIDGVYTCAEAARAAVDVPCEALRVLWLSKRPHPLTLADVTSLGLHQDKRLV